MFTTSIVYLCIEYGRYNMSPLLSQQLGQFSREIVDLLRHSPNCMMLFSKFIPNYHHHFGRQCRVADYGYTKLIELFEAIPHVVQVSAYFLHTVNSQIQVVSLI